MTAWFLPVQKKQLIQSSGFRSADFCFRKRVQRAGVRGGRARSCPSVCDRDGQAAGIIFSLLSFLFLRPFLLLF